MSTSQSAAKRTRLEVRLSEKEKALFERAAALAGRDLSDFVLSSLHATAEETIRNHQVIELTDSDTEILVQALLNPPEPNEALREALRRDREYLGE